MAASKPVIVVVHATSKQGTSVVNSLLQTGKFTVKAITRDANSDKAKQLAAVGAEVVVADAADGASLQSAFEGAYGVFALTVTIHGPPTAQEEYEAEVKLGKLQADAAAAAGVKVFVYSSAEDTTKLTEGKRSVPFCDAKAHVEEYVKTQHPSFNAAFPFPGSFYTNFAEFGLARTGEDGVFTFSLPISGDAQIPWVNPLTAMGPVAAAVFLDPTKYKNIFIPVYDEFLTPHQMVEEFIKTTGVKARYFEIPEQMWFGFGMPPVVAQAQWDMWKFFEEKGYYAPDRDTELVRKINPKPETWVEFLKKTGFDGSQSLAEVRAKFV